MSDAGRFVDEVLAEYPLAGCSLGIVTRDGLVDHAVRGIASENRPVDLDTVFRIGSVTKTMTALALLRQCEAGRFDLDDPVNDHLVDLELVGRPEWRAPTIRDLLTHTAGVGELAAWSDLRLPMIGLAVPVDQPAPDAARRYGGRLRLEVEPGTKWAYANHGFNVLGHLLETLSGEPYAQHLRSVLFEPLGMYDTDVVRSDRVRSKLATGYANRKRGLRKARDIDALPAVGSVLSTLPDLAAYVAALLDGGRGVVAPTTLASAFEPHYRPCATHPGMGLAFFRDDLGGRTVVGHGGGIPGFVTACSFAPSEGVGVVAFTNGGGQAVTIAAHRTLCALLGVDAGTPRDRPLRPDRWSDLVGYYRPGPGRLTNARVLMNLGGAVEIAVRRKRLVLRSVSPVREFRKGIPLVPADEDGLVYVIDLAGAAMPPLAIHIEHPPGRPVALHCGGPVAGAVPALHKTADWKNPRRAAGVLAAGAAVAVTGRRLTKRSI